MLKKNVTYRQRFIICNIQQQLKDKECSISIHVYRTQSMSEDEIQMLKDLFGEFIALHWIHFSLHFLIVNKLDHLFSSEDNPYSVKRVFFEIDAGFRLDNINLFGGINLSSCFPEYLSNQGWRFDPQSLHMYNEHATVENLPTHTNDSLRPFLKSLWISREKLYIFSNES